MSTPVGEILLGDYSVYELPTDDSCSSASCSFMDSSDPSKDSNVIVTALVARVEALEAKNKILSHKLKSKKHILRIANIPHNDALVKFYTGFPTYEQLLAFFRVSRTRG